jgi:hypothetical protein
MKAKTILTLTAVALLSYFNSVAQERPVRYELKFKAIAKTTTEAGKFVTKPLNERDIIKKCAEDADAGTTNLNRFMLVYEVGADYNGDVIRVVRKSDGTIICSPFRVLFQRSLTNWEERRDERIGFIYNGRTSDAMGSVLIQEKPIFRSDGTRGRFAIHGKFQMFDEIYHAERKAILTGSFVTGKELTW